MYYNYTTVQPAKIQFQIDKKSSLSNQIFRNRYFKNPVEMDRENSMSGLVAPASWLSLPVHQSPLRIYNFDKCSLLFMTKRYSNCYLLLFNVHVLRNNSDYKSTLHSGKEARKRYIFGHQLFFLCCLNFQKCCTHRQCIGSLKLQ